MKIRHLHHLHHTLLASLGTTAWESLHGRCADLLAAHGDAPGREELEADCRRVAFIRGYLNAYTRTGEFLEVDVQLAGAIHAVNEGAAKIEQDIERLLAELDALKTDVTNRDRETVTRLAGDAVKVGDQTEKLIDNAGSKIAQRFGVGSTTITDELTRLAGDIGRQSDALAQAADRGLTRDIARLVSNLDSALNKLKTKLEDLETRVASADSRLVAEINKEVGRADSKLSNVFKVSNTGFVSRDSEFQAKLPTLEFTVDPTVSHLLTVTDTDRAGQVLTGNTDFANLGVATDMSGVGTGTNIGAELVRVFLEAIFDAHEGLPAVAPANPSSIQPTGRTLDEYSLPLFNSPMGNVDARDLSEMNHTNTKVAAMTRSIMSRIVGGALSLDNPSLEAFIVEIVTSSVREATAKATWCWYACNLDVDVRTLETDAHTTVRDEAGQFEDEVKSQASQTVEHVKLRFRLEK